MKTDRSRLFNWVAALSGLALGIGLGFPDQAAVSDRKSKLPQIVKVESREAARPIERQRTFEQLVKRWHRSGRVPMGVVDWIDRSSSQEIQAEMMELAGSIQDDAAWMTNFNLRQILKVMAAELVRRDGDKALDWCVTTRSQPLMEVVAAALTEADPANLHRYRARYPEKVRELASSFFFGALNGAAMKGAAELLHENDASVPYDFEFAADFDFNAYLRDTKNSEIAILAFASWAARDPDSAAEALRQDIGDSAAGTSRLAAAFKGRAAMVGEAEAAAWVAELPFSSHPEIRKWQVHNFAERGMMKSRITALLDHLPTETDRVNFAAKALMPYAPDENAISVIAAQSSEEFKSQTIVTWALDRPVTARADPNHVELLMERFQISEPERQEIRSTISSAGE